MSHPLIAILRGIVPHEAAGIASALVSAGIDRIEVTLNSPSPYDSIAEMVASAGQTAQIGAGTVTSVDEVWRVKEAGGQFVVSPNTDVAVIRATKAAEMRSIPGVFTATECFTAIAAGADSLKFFPASLLGLQGLKAIRAVLPAGTQVFMVGGISAGNIAEWLSAGAGGFGFGTSLYAPGRDSNTVLDNAIQIVAAFERACQ